MTAIDTSKALINSRVVAGTPGSITAAKLNATLIALADAIVADRVPSNIPTSVSSPLSGANLDDVLTALAITLAAKADLASPALTGTPTAPTAATAVSSTQIATTAFVQNVVTALIDNSPGALDTLNELAAALGDDANFSATVTAALAEKAPLASPALTGTPTAPTASAATNTTQLATTEFVQTVVVAAAGLTANLKNYIVNPGMRVSQQNGTSSGTANAYYPADQWSVVHSQDGTLTSQQVASATPSGSPYRVRTTVTTADATLAAGQYAGLLHPIEGSRIADWLFGTADAKDLVVEFMVNWPAGTYAIVLKNAAEDRSYVREFTVSGDEANVDTIKTVTFPGDTSGTWPTGNVLGALLILTYATGTTFHTTADAWQAGNYLGTSSTTNGIGTVSDVFETGDVGLYADPDSTGVAPEFLLPNYDSDLRDCQRYYQKGISYGGARHNDNYIHGFINWPTPLRIAPTLSFNIAPTATITNTTSSWAGYLSSVISGAWQPIVTANARM